MRGTGRFLTNQTLLATNLSVSKLNAGTSVQALVQRARLPPGLASQGGAWYGRDTSSPSASGFSWTMLDSHGINVA
jgi:hypothetical protein